MKKQQKQFPILLVVLVALVGCLLGLRQYNQKQSEQPAEQEEIITVASLNSEEILRFSYDYEGTTYSFVKEDGTWYYTEDKSLSLIQTGISDMIAGVAPLTAEMAIENVTDMTQYGLAESERTLQLEAESESVTLLVGDYNSMSDVYYLCKAGDTTVYTVSPAVVEAFDRSLEDVTDTTGGSAGDAEENADDVAGNVDAAGGNADAVAGSADAAAGGSADAVVGSADAVVGSADDAEGNVDAVVGSVDDAGGMQMMQREMQMIQGECRCCSGKCRCCSGKCRDYSGKYSGDNNKMKLIRAAVVL